jgi:purine-nucleoside phosphorylase
MIDRRTPSEKMLAADAHTIEGAAGGKIELALVLGSGLSSAVGGTFPHAAIAYDRLLGIPVAALQGHAGEALVGEWHGRRVLVFAGRVHLYQGFSAAQVTVSVRLAHAAGAKRIVLTNAAGSLDPALVPGDLMLIADQINLTGRNPLSGTPEFVDMSEAYAPALRALVQGIAKPAHRLKEGVYAGMHGPSYETPAEARYLRAIGAQAVGMSTVLETIAARALGMEVLGISAIAGVAGKPTTHAEIAAQAGAAGTRLAELLDGLVSEL